TFDGYGSRMVYAVTMTSTDNTTYNENKGGIAVRDANGGSLTKKDGDILFAIISPGKSKVGAYSKYANLTSACPTGAGAPLDAENCNVGFDSGTATSTQSIYISAQNSTAPGTGFFDDVVSYFSSSPDPTWRRTIADPENIEDLSTNFVGAGTSAPGADLSVDSTGTRDSIRIYGQDGSDGKLMADQICDDTGANCFDPIVIAGDNSVPGEGMKCAAGYMVGIENGAPKCVPHVSVTCGPGEVLVGFIGTVPDCQPTPVVSCGATTIPLCGGSSSPINVNLPNGADGSFFPADGVSFIGPAGDDNCYTANFECTGGAWQIKDQRGTCKAGLNSGTPKYYSKCKSFMGHSGNPSSSGAIVQAFDPGPPKIPLLKIYFGWKGKVYYQNVTACTNSGVVSTYDVSDCDCKDDDTTTLSNLSCPPPYTGVNKRKITYKAQCELAGNPVNALDLVPYPANPNVTPKTPRIHYGLNAGPPDDSACSCGDSPAWEFKDCQQGFKRKSSPVPASFASPVDSWPPDIRKGVYRKKNVDGSTCNVSYDSWNSSNCECDTSVSYNQNTTTCADPVCEEPKTNLVTISGYPGAGNVPDGKDVFEVTRDPAASCTVKSTQIKTGNCTTKAFTWVDNNNTNGNAYSDQQPPIKSGSACSCNDHINTTSSTVPCYRPADNSKTIYFCKCQ
ncbi:MAG TPA: hypothetical protein PLK94_04145, partial [Alphaproteobacteria bacterium]|nr:hypothetical protein [Alphaproteobacteria bacterium]